jgi:hypothetical protein
MNYEEFETMFDYCMSKDIEITNMLIRIEKLERKIEELSNRK